MDDQSKRMLLLGRQAPPKELDLRLEPCTYVSPHHAPVADVVYRVEKHLSISSPGDRPDDLKPPHKPIENTQDNAAKLSKFRKRVKERAAQAQKEMRSISLQWQKEKQSKRDFLLRRQEYARRVAASNSLKSARIQGRAACAEGSSSDDDSDCSQISSICSDRVPKQAEYRCRSSPPASPSRTYIEMMTEQGPCDRSANQLGAVHVCPRSTVHTKRLASPVSVGKRVPVPGPSNDFAHIETRNLDVTYSAESNRFVDMPVAPPGHVKAQTYAWERQEELYRGAACPCVASDDLDPVVSGLKDVANVESMPVQSSGKRNEVSLEPGGCFAKLQATDFLSHRDIARRSLLRHCSMSRETYMELESEQHQACPTSWGAVAYASGSHTAQSLNHTVGGGSGLLEAPLSSSHGGGMMRYTRIASPPDESPQMKANCAYGTMHPTPTVRVSRNAGAAAVPLKGETMRSERRTLGVNMLPRLEDKVKQMNLTLPQLCTCHNVPVLDPGYISHCACNCTFYQNESLYLEMLHGLLLAYGVVV